MGVKAVDASALPMRLAALRHSHEVTIDAETYGPALLRMELGGYQIIPGIGAAEWEAVFGSADNPCICLGLGVLAVDKIEVAA